MGSAMSMVGLVALGITGWYLFKINQEQQEMIEECNSEIESFQTEIQTLEQEYSNCRSDLATANNDNSHCMEQIESLETEIQESGEVISNCRRDLAEAISSNEMHKAKLNESKLEIGSLEIELQTQTETLSKIEFELEHLITKFPGLKLELLKFNTDSVILKDQSVSDKFYDLLVPKLQAVMNITDFDLSLLYRYSEDGNSAQAFHDHTDGHTNTLILIQSDKGCVFGGYTNVDWGLATGYQEDPQAFIYRIKSASDDTDEGKGYYPVKHSPSAVFIHQDKGPSFGGGHDLTLQPIPYIFGGSSYNTDGKNICAGQLRKHIQFKIDDYEVFQVVPN